MARRKVRRITNINNTTVDLDRWHSLADKVLAEIFLLVVAFITFVMAYGPNSHNITDTAIREITVDGFGNLLMSVGHSVQLACNALYRDISVEKIVVYFCLVVALIGIPQLVDYILKLMGKPQKV